MNFTKFLLCYFAFVLCRGLFQALVPFLHLHQLVYSATIADQETIRDQETLNKAKFLTFYLPEAGPRLLQLPLL